MASAAMASSTSATFMIGGYTTGRRRVVTKHGTPAGRSSRVATGPGRTWPPQKASETVRVESTYAMRQRRAGIWRRASGRRRLWLGALGFADSHTPPNNRALFQDATEQKEVKQQGESRKLRHYHHHYY